MPCRIPDFVFHGGADEMSAFEVPWWRADAGHEEALTLATGEGVVVAVLDTGFDAEWSSQEPWRSRLLGTVPIDGNGHGTHVAGIVAAIAPAARILVVQVFDAMGRGENAIVARAWKEAVAAGAHVVNFSGGSPTHDDQLADACAFADGRNVINVVASGNSGPTRIAFPAADKNTTSVAAHDRQRKVASFSSPSDVDCAAAGVQVESLWLAGGRASLSGTSMASPMIAGAAALWIELARKLGAPIRGGDFLRDLAASATDIEAPGKDVRTGAGAVHFHRLLTTLADRVKVKPPPNEELWKHAWPARPWAADGREYAVCSREVEA